MTHLKKLLLGAIVSFASTAPAIAEPWVNPTNAFLRASIQRLADIGLITTPTTTFPLMWHDIGQDLKNAYLFKLSEADRDTLLYVQHELKRAKKNQKVISVNAANRDHRFSSFGDSFRDKNNISFDNSFMTDSFAFKLSPSYNSSPLDGDEKIRHDGSYAAAFAGNWVFSIGMQDKWWGPGWDTSLSMSTNARPMPALTVSRKSAQPFTIPFTEIDIPWTVTSFMAVMDDDREVKDTLLWGFRMNFKPTQNLEIGLTRLAQWAGDGRPNSLSTFWDVLKGLDNCGGNGPTAEECRNGEEPGNQLAGYDFRWSTQVLEQPLALYFTSFAEDGDSKGGLSILGEERYQVGLETTLDLFEQPWKFYLEGTDTYAKCKDGVNGDGSSNIGDCYYEHHIYKTGMRYNQRSIGNIYENDATSLVFGMLSQANTNTNYEFKLRWLQLNKDNSDKAPNDPLIGNTLTPIAENMLMLSGKVQHSYRQWRFTLGSDVSRSEYDNDIDSKTNYTLSLNVEYNL